MLPKINRVNTREVDEIFSKGKFLNSPIFTFKYIKISKGVRKISFIAPKSVARLAVKRNSLRRKGYTALKKFINLSPAGIIGVFVFRKNIEDSTGIENEIKNILDKIN